MPIPHYRPISYIKTAILWSFYYLRNNSTYEEAVKDIISRGGDTKNNAAIVGGLIGAAQGIGNCKKEIVGINEILGNLSFVVKNAPTTLIVDWSGKKLANLEEIKTHYENEVLANW